MFICPYMLKVEAYVFELIDVENITKTIQSYSIIWADSLIDFDI